MPKDVDEHSDVLNPTHGFGFDPSAVSVLPDMGMGGDINQMQMMMAMQNGMGGFGQFPMLGMPKLTTIFFAHQLTTHRNGWNEHGPNDAKHDDERRIWSRRHGHGTWDGRIRRWSWSRIQ